MSAKQLLPRPCLEQLGDAANRGDIGETRRLVDPGRCEQGVLDFALARATCMKHLGVADYLVEHGANVNGAYGGDYGPVILASCEFLNPDGVRFLLDHGANPNLEGSFSKDTFASPLGMALGTYVRSPNKYEVVEMLLAAGAKHDQHDAVMAIHLGRTDELELLIEANPDLVDQRFDEVDYLWLPLNRGSPTLLHIAADYNEVEIGRLLLAKRAEINVPATLDVEGIGGQTPIYHTVASWTLRDPEGACMPFLKFLLEGGADLNVRANVRFETGASSCEGQTLKVTPMEFALKFQNGPVWRNTASSVELLRKSIAAG